MVDNSDGFFSVLGPLNAKQLKKRTTVVFGDPAQAKVSRAQVQLEKAQQRFAQAVEAQHAPKTSRISVTEEELRAFEEFKRQQAGGQPRQPQPLD